MITFSQAGAAKSDLSSSQSLAPGLPVLKTILRDREVRGHLRRRKAERIEMLRDSEALRPTPAPRQPRPIPAPRLPGQIPMLPARPPDRPSVRFRPDRPRQQGRSSP